MYHHHIDHGLVQCVSACQRYALPKHPRLHHRYNTNINYNITHIHDYVCFVPVTTYLLNNVANVWSGYFPNW